MHKSMVKGRAVQGRAVQGGAVQCSAVQGSVTLNAHQIQNKYSTAQCTMQNAQCKRHNAKYRTVHNAQCTMHKAKFTTPDSALQRRSAEKGRREKALNKALNKRL